MTEKHVIKNIETVSGMFDMFDKKEIVIIIKLVHQREDVELQPYLSCNWQCILSFSTHMTHPLLNLKRSILLLLKGGLKHLLLLYKRLIQLYLSLLWLLLATHFVIRVTPIDVNYSTNHLKSKSRH